MKWLLLAFSLNTSVAQIPNHVQHEVDQRVKHEYNQGIVLGLYSNNAKAYHVSGWSDKDKQLKLNLQSVFEIGSITKTMTGLMLADEIIKNKVSLDDHIDELLPDDLKLKSPDSITLKQLATHTSGLPRLPPNLNLFMSNDPYADYQRKDLFEAISSEVIDSDNQIYKYSNYGVGLLGEALANLNQDQYQNLLKKRIFEPLNLNHSYADASLVPEAQLVTGYSGKNPAPHWHFKALAGAGSVNSSIEDLLSFGVAILKADHPELKQAIALSKQIHHHENGIMLGLNWHFDNGIIWHNGGTAGFRSILMIDQKNNTVAAGITNQSEHPVEDVVGHLLNSDKSMKTFDFPVEINDKELQKFKGEFHNNVNQKTIVTSIKNGHLMLHFPKQPAYQLTYLGNNKFIMNLTKTRIRFESSDSKQFDQLYFKAWGDEQVYLQE